MCIELYRNSNKFNRFLFSSVTVFLSVNIEKHLKNCNYYSDFLRKIPFKILLSKYLNDYQNGNSFFIYFSDKAYVYFGGKIFCETNYDKDFLENGYVFSSHLNIFPQNVPKKFTSFEELCHLKSRRMGGKNEQILKKLNENFFYTISFSFPFEKENEEVKIELEDDTEYKLYLDFKVLSQLSGFVKKSVAQKLISCLNEKQNIVYKIGNIKNGIIPDYGNYYQNDKKVVKDYLPEFYHEVMKSNYSIINHIPEITSEEEIIYVFLSEIEYDKNSNFFDSILTLLEN